MLSPLPVPDYASTRTRELAAALNVRIQAANTAAADARRCRDETKTKPPAALATDLDLMSCDVPDPGEPEEVTQARRDFLKAEVAYLREEVRIRQDLPPYEQSVQADYAGHLAEVEEELADEIDKIKDGLAKLGFDEFVEAPAPQTTLGSFGPQPQALVDVFVANWHPRVSELTARHKSIVAACPPNPSVNKAAIAQAEQKLRELLHPTTPAQADKARQDLIERSKLATAAMYEGMARSVDRRTFANLNEVKTEKVTL